MSKAKPSKLGGNIPSLTPQPVNLVSAMTRPSKGTSRRAGQTQFTFWLPDELAERLKNTAWWERTTAHAIITAALEAELTLRETENNKGKPYGKRAG